MTPDRRRLGTEDGEHARAPCGKQAWDGIEEKAPQPQHRGKAGQKKEEKELPSFIRREFVKIEFIVHSSFQEEAAFRRIPGKRNPSIGYIQAGGQILLFQEILYGLYVIPYGTGTDAKTGCQIFIMEKLSGRV